MAGRLPSKSRNINYLSKDFDSVKADLQEYLRRYFPNTIQDFNDASGGMAILELLAYVADIMSFQIDRTVNETFITKAVERKNLISLAKGMGYTPKSLTPASVSMTIEATFDKTISSDTTFIVNPGTRLTSPFEPINFELIDKADFSSSHNRETIFDDGTFVTYSISGVKAMAGRSKIFRYQVPADPKPFLGITLPDRLVTEVVSVQDITGTEFFEVDNLATDLIFSGDSNVAENTEDIDYVLKMRKVPNRYVVERETDGTLTIRFGAGRSTLEDSEVMLNPEDFVLPPKLKGYVDGFPTMSLDTTNFLRTKSLGNLPKPNSILEITYRVGGGIATNIGANVLTKSLETIAVYTNSQAEITYPNQSAAALASLTFNNPEAAYGGEEEETNNSIRHNSINNINSQNRCVTLQDYKIRAMSMPTEFGKVFRLTAVKDPYKSSGIELITISRNEKGQLVNSNEILKNNLETYIKKYKGVTDSVRFSDGNIVNMGVNFSLYPASGFNKDQALINCILLIREYLNITSMDFGVTISISDLLRNLQNLDDVAAIPSIKFVNITGEYEQRDYSAYSLNIDSITRNNIIYFPPNVIPEVKFTNYDIQGTLA